MKPTLKALAVTLAGVMLAPCSLAQNFPSRPVRFVVAYAAGGPTDIASRIVAQTMEKRLGQPVVVENHPGAGAVIGNALVVRADPDGYTLGFSNVLSVTDIFIKNNPIDVKKDLAPVSNLFAGSSVFVVRPGLPVKTAQEFITYARANPGKLNIAVTGPIFEMLGEVLRVKNGISFSTVPYKGEGPEISALMSGEVDGFISSVLGILPYVQSGRARPLFSTKYRERSRIFPDLPTSAEAGLPDYASEYYWGLWAPAGTPRSAVQKLSADATATVRQPELAEQFRKLGVEPLGTTPEELMRSFEADYRFWANAAAIAKFQPE